MNFVKTKFLLLLALGCMHEAQPMYMARLTGLQKASFKLAKDAGLAIHKHLYWEDVAVAALVCGAFYFTWKYWANDDVIKARYKKEINSLNLKELFAQNVEKVELASHSAVHMPDLFSEDEGPGDEEGFYDLENSFKSIDGLAYKYRYVHKVNRGIWWDTHKAFIETRPSREDFDADTRELEGESSVALPKEKIQAKSTAEIIAFEAQVRAQELKQKQEEALKQKLEDEARRKKEAEDVARAGSPGHEGLGL